MQTETVLIFYDMLSKTCYRSKLILMMNVKIAYHLDISGKSEGGKGNKRSRISVVRLQLTSKHFSHVRTIECL